MKSTRGYLELLLGMLLGKSLNLLAVALQLRLRLHTHAALGSSPPTALASVWESRASVWTPRAAASG